jgi:hypothetical protein
VKTSTQTVLLQEIIADLTDPEKSLVSPLMKLNHFAKRIKNDIAINFTSRELEGYLGVEDEEIPAYRKTIA